jgi:hypothetical protein
MEEHKSRISEDIIRSFRKNLDEDVMFMCLYMSKTDGGIVTNERPFTGKETIDLLSAVIEGSEDFIVPAIMYSLFNVYGPIKVFDIVKDYSRGFDMKGPFKVDPGADSSVPPVSEN